MIENLFTSELLLSVQVVAQAGILGFIVSALVTAVLLIACAYLLPGVHINDFMSALILGVIVGVIVGIVGALGIGNGNGLISGLIALLVTAGALTLGDKVMDSVRLDGFVWALAVAAIIGLVNGFLPTLF